MIAIKIAITAKKIAIPVNCATIMIKSSIEGEGRFMKLDDLRRLSAAAPEEKRERLRQALEGRGSNWGDMYQELEMSHRYVDAYRHESMEGGHVPLHSHSFYELLYCRNSCGMEYLLGPSRYRLQRGDLVFTPPGVDHRPLLTGRLVEPCRRDVIWLSQEFMAQTALAFPFPSRIDWEQPFLLRTAGTPWEGLGDHIQAGVQEALRRAPGWEACVAGNTMVLLTLLARALSGGDSAPLASAERPELLERVFAYIEAHLGEPITLADTARHFWVSESKISQTFRQKLGVSFYRCVTQRRLIAAKSLIVQGAPLNTVNERVGFADYSAFFRAFKREYGVAPSQFRALQAGREPDGLHPAPDKKTPDG